MIIFKKVSILFKNYFDHVGNNNDECDEAIRSFCNSRVLTKNVAMTFHRYFVIFQASI